MRLSLTEVEKLTPAPFVLVAGLFGGALQAAAEFVHDRAAGAIAFLAVNGAAVLLWWLSVRRRQHSVWSAAGQITLSLALAQILSFGLVIPRVVPANVHLRWLDVAETEFFTQLWLSPLRFVGAVLLVAFGRFLPGSGRGHAGHPTASTMESRDAVT